MSDDRRPNAVLIVVHDLGTRLGCYGVGSAPSPRLDAFAAEGVRFQNHFATATFCSPSRGAIITGKHPHVNGLMGLVNLDWDLPASNATLANLLGGAGYETCLLGLQHEMKDATQLGFDFVSDRSTGSRCEVVAPIVVDFLRERGQSRERPFYARVGFSEVHRPYERYTPEDPDQVDVLPYLKDTPGLRQDLAMFDGCIREMDRAVGSVLDAVDEAGLRNDTIVVFTTDHGIAFPRAKSTLYDPGIHTTLLMRWPAGFRGGQVPTELISNVAVLPSLLEAAGAPVPEDVQGRSFLPLLRGEEYTPNEVVFAEKNTLPLDIKRGLRTERYKYIRNYDEGSLLFLPTDTESGLTRRDMGNDHLQPRPPVELYDLQADPLEMNNVAGQAEYADIEAELAQKLQSFLEETNDPVLTGSIPRPAGEAEIIRQVFSSIEKRSPFPREGLLTGHDF